MAQRWVRMVKYTRPGRLDPDRLGDGQAIQDRADRLHEPRSKCLLVIGGQGGDESNVHQRALSGTKRNM